MLEYFTFDDVLILPQHSDINSRELISTGTDFLGLKLDVPIISSNMDYVTGSKMAIAMHEAGGLGILHRFMPWSEQLEALDEIYANDTPVALSVGVREATNFADLPYDDIIVCIDVAHGDHDRVVSLIENIKTYYPHVKIIAGNVATAEGYSRLSSAGADAIKVGIGPGSVCTTREVTGVGVPQLSAIMNVAARRASIKGTVQIIADGGIKNSGDMVKALAAGADVVMLGSLLAGASECPVEAIETADGHRLKPYRGQSIFGVNGAKFTPEGISGYVFEKGPVKDIIKQLRGGLRSGMSYVGAMNLDELRENTEFIRISPGTQVESSTRIRTII